MKKKYKIDIHLNLAGTGTQKSGCYASSKFIKRYTIRGLRLLEKISNKELHTDFDQNWVMRLENVLSQSPADFGVVLGFDSVFDKNGIQMEKYNQMVIPASWVFAACKQASNLLPGPGVNPYRKDALVQLQWCIDQGAVLIKWLPPAQNIDPSQRCHIPFYQKLADAKLPLLVHTGGERTFRSFNHRYGDITRLRLALEQGVTVIAAHGATPTLGSRDPDQTTELLSMLADFPNLWIDNSGMCNPGRFRSLPNLADNSAITARTLYGSDWPIPMNAFYFINRFGWKKTLALERISNPIARDIAIKQAFGFPDKTMTAANAILPSLKKWTSHFPSSEKN